MAIEREVTVQVRCVKYENGDTILRFFSKRGSYPLVLVDEGNPRNPSDIGDELVQIIEQGFWIPTVDYYPDDQERS